MEGAVEFKHKQHHLEKEFSIARKHEASAHIILFFIHLVNISNGAKRTLYLFG
jgi:hypothetical protein